MAHRLDAVERPDAEAGMSAEDAATPKRVSVNITRVGDDASDWWNDYATRSGSASIYHRYEWRALIESIFRKHTLYLAARDEVGRCIGLLPLVHMKSRLFGNFMVSMPYFTYGGAIADDSATLQRLTSQAAQYAGDLGCTHIEYRMARMGPLSLPLKTTKVTMDLPLPSTADELWKTFKPKLRSQIRRPQKAGATATIGGVELAGDFYRVFATNMRDLGTPVYPLEFFRKILSTFPSSAVALVHMDQHPVAAGIVIGAGDRLEIPWASSLRSHNRFSPNMLLYWSIMEWAIRNGYKTFDFGRCTQGSGTYRFKEQWGAEERSLFWYYWVRDAGPLPDLSPANPKYAAAIRLWQKLPVPLTKLIGPHIVKHLP